MFFSLEVLQAKHGDCLLLHYGNINDPKIMVIDGGPSGIYRNFLKPRLLKIKESRSQDDPLPISMVMVSHVDDDHINGIVMLTNELAAKLRDDERQDFLIENFWFNSFDDIIGNIELPAISSIGASSQSASISSLGISLLTDAPEHISAVIASTGQGRLIRNNAEFLTLAVNEPFTELQPGKARLVRGDSNESEIELDELKISVIHPNEKRLKELQKEWDEDLKKALQAGDNSIIFASIASLDKSPFNLSSIVCLVELSGKKILLTGDGRSDDILEGLKQNDQLDENGKLHVDILKFPHHGSIANMTAELLQKVTADHYVISADGAHHNPDQSLLELIEANVTQGVLYLTNHEGKLGLKDKLDSFIQKLQSENHQLQIKFRNEQKPSFIINLLDDIDF